VAVLINKIDTLRPDDRERFVARTQAQIGAGAAPVLPVAFDPLPQLAPAPMGVDVVRRWLADAVLTLGKTPAALGPYGPPPGG
jgi:hypothetical protein